MSCLVLGYKDECIIENVDLRDVNNISESVIFYEICDCFHKRIIQIVTLTLHMYLSVCQRVQRFTYANRSYIRIDRIVKFLSLNYNF